MGELAKHPETRDLSPEEKRRIAMGAWTRTPPEFFRRDAVADLRIVARKAAEFTERLAAWHCYVLVADQPELLTSDNPVAIIRSEPDSDRWTGVFPNGADVQLALSPTVLAVLTPYPHVSTGERMTTAAIQGHNETMARDAHHAVIHHPATVWRSESPLARQHLELGPACVRFSVGDPGTPPTFPVRYPQISDPAIAQIVRELGGNDVVE
jgi:hypothetical protein